MPKPTPLFRAVLVRVTRYDDTNSVKLNCRVTHAALAGEDVHELTEDHALLTQPLVTIRLAGADALDALVDSYADRLGVHEEATVGPGTVILFTARGVAAWNGSSTFQNEALHRLIGFEPASLSILPRLKRLALVFARQRSRVEEAASGAVDDAQRVASRPAAQLEAKEAARVP